MISYLLYRIVQNLQIELVVENIDFVEAYINQLLIVESYKIFKTFFI